MKKILKNGLTIISQENNNSKLCTIAFIIKSGSFNESDKEHGIAHLIEHMLFKGTINRTYEEINKQIESIGGYINAQTSFDYTKFHVTIPYDKWDIGVDILSDMIFNSRIDKDELKKEKKVVQEEIKMYYDDLPSFTIDKLYCKMFKNYNNRQTITGTVKSVENITRDNILNFIQKNYVPDNMILLVNGNVQINNFIKFMNNFFDKLNITFNKFNNYYPQFELSKNSLNNKLYKFKRKSNQNHLTFGMFLPTIRSDEIYPCMLLNIILGGNCSSILYNNIREKKGLCYEISTTLEYINDVTVLSGYAGLNKENNVINEIIDIFNNLKNLINDELVKNSKEYMKGILYRQNEKTSDINAYISDCLIHKTSYSIEDLINKLENVKLIDIKNIIDKYFNETNLCFVETVEE